VYFFQIIKAYNLFHFLEQYEFVYLDNIKLRIGFIERAKRFGKVFLKVIRLYYEVFN